MLRLSRFLCNYVAIISRTLAARRGFDSFFSDDVSVLPVRNTRGSGTPAHKYILTRALSQALTHTPADAHSSCPASAANMESKPDTSDKSQKQRRVLQAPSPPLDSNPAFAARKTNKQANKPPNKQPPPPPHQQSRDLRSDADAWGPLAEYLGRNIDVYKRKQSPGEAIRGARFPQSRVRAQPCLRASGCRTASSRSPVASG